MHLLIQKLLFWFMIALLTACGGGSDEPSGLFEDTGGNVGGTPLSDEGTDVQVSFGAPPILASGSTATVSLITYEASETSLIIEPNVTFAATIVSGQATLKNVPTSTNHEGKASFTVTHPGSGYVEINLSGTGRYVGGFNFPMYFGASVTAKIIGENTVPADGQTPVNINVLVRNWGGVGIPGIFVDFAFPLDSFAVPTALGVTDQNGEFLTSIINSVAQETKVTPIAASMAAGPLTLNFVTGIVSGTTIEIIDLIIKNNNVLANGTDVATIVVIARDTSGTPIRNVPISISSDSATARLRSNLESNELFVTGNTGEAGRFELNLTNTIEETVNIKASSKIGETTVSAEQEIVFANPDAESPSGAKVAKIEIDEPVISNDAGALANGIDTVTLVGKVFDSETNPLAEVPVSILVSGGSATLKMANEGKTNQGGFFIATFTDRVAETFSARAVVGNLSSELKTISFIAVPPPEQTPESEVLPVAQSITLLASPEQQNIAEAGITLTVIVRDNKNTPMSGIPVTMTASSSTAVFDSNINETGSSGAVTFKLTETVPGPVTVFATVESQTGTLTAEKSVTFVTTETEIIESRGVNSLDVIVINDKQPANGRNAVQIDVIAKNQDGQPESGVPLIVQMSAGVEANAEPAEATTGEGGFFSTQITSTQAGQINVVIAVAGGTVTPQTTTIEFVAISLDPVENIIEPKQVELEVLNNNQAADGQSKITVVVTPRDENDSPIKNINVELISNSDSAKFCYFGENLENCSSVGKITGQTNSLGEFPVTVISEVPETFQVTPVVGEIQGNAKNITFIQTISESKAVDLTVTVVESTNHQPATGKFKKDNSAESDAITIQVMARDPQGRAVAGIPISVRIPQGIVAVANPAQDITDANGLFETYITSTRAGDVNVTVAIEGTDVVKPPVTVTFDAISGDTPGVNAIAPVRIDLEVVNSPQPADGKAKIALVVIPRDINNAPITEVVYQNEKGETQREAITLELISDSGIKIDPKTDKPNVLGEFYSQVTSEAVGKFKVTPVASWAEKGAQKKLIGTAVEVEFVLPITLREVGELQVTVVNDNQPAVSGEIKIEVVARNNSGQAMANVPLAVIIDSGSAVAAPATGLTDANGFFNTTIKSPVPGEFAITIQVQGTNITAAPQLLNFIVEGGDVTPTNIELRVENAPQPADGSSAITLIVIPRDDRGNQLSNVEIKLIPDVAEKVIIEPASGPTNALGEFRATVKTSSNMTDTLTEALVVNITPVVTGGITGNPVPVIFRPVAVSVPTTLSLSTSGNPIVNQDITLTVLAQDEVYDANGVVIGNIPLAGVKVRLLVQPLDGIVFGASGFEGNTESNGAFQTTIKSTLTGTIRVTAEALGRSGEPILTSNTINIIIQPEGVEEPKEVSSIRLIANSFQLGSEGNSNGVIITAIVKDKSNNLVEGVEINFSADSGEILPIETLETVEVPVVDPLDPGANETTTVTRGSKKTDESGRSQARLTTQSNADNRTITVTATVPSVTGEVLQDSLTVNVVGTTLSIAGPSAVVINNEIALVISLRNSAGKGIAGQTLELTSQLGNLFDNPAPVTNALGQAEVILTASNAGIDTITASKAGADSGNLQLAISDSNFVITPVPLPAPHQERCISLEANEDINNNRVLDEGEDVNQNGKLDLGCQVPINLPAGVGQQINIHWDEGGVNQVNEKIILSTTRGRLDNNEIRTDLINGDASFTVFPGGDTGNALITIRAERPDGPSRQIALKFVAQEARTITIQANPAVIGVNLGGATNEQSEIVAVVRDPENNLVFGKRVDFALNDISGGRLTQGSAITDDFGRATTVYIAGPSSSAANGVEITAQVADAPDVSKLATLTVAKRALFVTVGSGNELEKIDGRKYNVFHTVLVTDANGTPVSDAEVTLSVYPLLYSKGGTFSFECNLGGSSCCPNEDQNRNGLLDQSDLLTEDTNGNEQLDPGNVITVDNLVLTTDDTGFADFNVSYAIQYAQWITVEIIARASVAGSEGSNRLQLDTICLDADAVKNICPIQNPFGVGECNQPF